MKKFFAGWASGMVSAALLLAALLLFGPNAPAQSSPAFRPFIVDPAALYTAYNDAYFEGMLPRDTQVVERYIKSNQRNAVTLGRTKLLAPNKFLIEISPENILFAQEAGTVLHESCHVWVYEYGRGSQDMRNADNESHGPQWQACMIRLAEAHAFANIW